MPNRKEQFNDDNPALKEAWRQICVTVPRFRTASLFDHDHPDRIDHIVVDLVKLPVEAIIRQHWTLEQYATPLRYGSYAVVLAGIGAIVWAIL